MEPVLRFTVRDGVAEGEAMDTFPKQMSDKAQLHKGSPHMLGLLRSSQKDRFAIRAPSVSVTPLFYDDAISPRQVSWCEKRKRGERHQEGDHVLMGSTNLYIAL